MPNLRQGIVSYLCTGDSKCPASGVETMSQQDLASLDPKCAGLGTCPLGPGANPAVMALFQQYPHPNSSAVGRRIEFPGLYLPCFDARQPQYGKACKPLVWCPAIKMSPLLLLSKTVLCGS
jgi:hypothetical protein